MEFGAFVPQGWRLDLAGIAPDGHWETMMGVAGAFERAGYRSLWVYDHFHTVPEPTQEPTYEAWTLMASLAVATETVRLGQMCTSNSYRPPPYLAKVAASIDVISDGRLEMGIGAGWYEDEYLGYGYEFPKASVRIGQLEEGVEIMRRLWTEEQVDFEGEYYRLKGGICRPRPFQDPHPPFWVAGGGERLTLAVATRYASYSNFGAGDLEVFKHKSEVLAGHCRDQGRDFDEIVRSANFDVVIAEDEAGVEEQLQAITDRYRSYVEESRVQRTVERLRNNLAGTPEQIAEELQAWAEAGLGYAICYFPQAAYDTSGLELFARSVIPELA